MKRAILPLTVLALAPFTAQAAHCPTLKQVKVEATGALPNGRYVVPYPSQMLTGDPEERIRFRGMRITYLDPRNPQYTIYAKIKCDYRITVPRPGRRDIWVSAVGDITDVVQSRESYERVRGNRRFWRMRGPNRYYCTAKKPSVCKF